MAVAIKNILFVLFILFLSSCGGSSSLTALDAVGIWLGRFLQSGGVECVDSFIGACSGCELGDIKVEISESNGNYRLDVEHCMESNEREVTCTTCIYNGEESSTREIIAVTEDLSCAAEVRFTLMNTNKAELFEDGRPPSGNKCSVDVISSLTRK